MFYLEKKNSDKKKGSFLFLQFLVFTLLCFYVFPSFSDDGSIKKEIQSSRLLISGSYSYSIGMINTNGVSGTIGIQKEKQFFGGVLNLGLGNKSFKMIDVNGLHTGFMGSFSRFMLGIGALYSRQVWNLNGFVSIDPGLCVGLWMIYDFEGRNKVNSHVEYFGLRCKSQVLIKRFSLFLEPVILMNHFELTPQVNIGLSYLL